MSVLHLVPNIDITCALDELLTIGKLFTLLAQRCFLDACCTSSKYGTCFLKPRESDFLGFICVVFLE